jgi:RIO kinase 1
LGIRDTRLISVGDVLKPKIRLEDVKEFKIERKVFDDRTLFAIFKLMKRGFIKTVESLISEGKESLILSAKGKDESWLALKVYKTEHCDFKSMWKYLVGDPRFTGIRKDRWLIVTTWCKREFKNLKIAFEGGVSCPEPIASNQNVLLTRFIGEDGIPAPRLVDINLEKPQDVYDFIVEEMKKLAKANLIHTDLSGYNIVYYDKPYLIDFSQAVTEKHPLAKELLKRDVNNINNFFKNRGVKINENLFEELTEVMELER